MDKKKKIIIIAVIAALVAALAAWLIVSGNKDEESSSSSPTDSIDLTEDDDLIEKDDGNGIGFTEEDDEYEVEATKHDISDFYGTWEATSDRAAYLYGSIEVTVNKDGTWTATVTEEPLGGDWTDEGDHIHLNDTLAELFSFDLSFDKGGELIMTDSENDDTINIVLTKK